MLLVVRSQGGVPGTGGVPGGQIGMVQLARALARRDVEVALFVGGPRMEYLSGLDGVPTTYFRWPLFLDRLTATAPNRVRSLGKSMRRRRWLDALTTLPAFRSADVVHVQGLEDGEAVLTKAEPPPLIVTHWGRVGRWSARPSDSDPRLHGRIARIRDRMTLVAIGEEQGHALAAAGMPPVDVIPPGIDLDHFRPEDRRQARQRISVPLDQGIVLYVGRLAPDKNVDALMTAFAALPHGPRRARMIILGDGPQRGDLQRLAARLTIEASTTFVPFVPHQELPWYYRSADVMVVPSNRLETFCMVALEAIACRCPVVVSEHVPEIANRFPDVTLVATDDVNRLRDVLDRALDGGIEPAATNRMADYDWSAVARRYESLYHAAVRRT